MKSKNIIIIILSIIIVIMAVIILKFTVFKSDNNNNSNPTNEPKKNLTAEEVLIKLKEQNSNIGNYVVYTEETDINKLMGRPNQYISKVTFEDIRLEQVNQNLDPEYFSEEEINEPTGGTIEVFNNAKDMKARKDYVEAVTSSFSALIEYSYSNDYILLRLNHDLTPTQAKEYEEIFNNILN